MLKKIAIWLIIFGLSISPGMCANQGIAFLCVHLVINCLLFAGAITAYVTGDAGLSDDIVVYQRLGILVSILLGIVGNVCIILFATWATTQIFGVDFFVSYQIMCFGQCLCSPNKKE